MSLDEFEQWIYENYTIGDNAMARDLLNNVLVYAERHFQGADLYDFLCDVIPQVPDRVIRTIY